LKYVALFFAIAVAVQAQTAPPTLPAVNVVTGTDESCSFESQDDTGGLFTQCKALSDASITYTSVVEASTSGAIAGHGSIMCLYWTESAGKNRLQCGDAKKVVVDGYLPSVTRKRRWFLFWR